MFLEFRKGIGQNYARKDELLTLKVMIGETDYLFRSFTHKGMVAMGLESLCNGQPLPDSVA